jgi:hypothetical protein
MYVFLSLKKEKEEKGNIRGERDLLIKRIYNLF